MGPAFVCDLVGLLTALLGNHAGEAQGLEHGQRGVHRAWARGIRPTEPALELLDDLVPVPGFLLQQAQNHVFEVALLEHPAGPAAPMAAPWRPATPVPKRVPA